MWIQQATRRLAAAALGLLLTAAAQGETLWQESFDDAERWQLTLRDGAAGELSLDEAGAVSGPRSLRVVKHNALGCMLITPRQPLAVKADVVYRFEARYRSDDAPLGNLLLFRVSSDLDRIAYDAVDRSAGWLGNSLVVNTPPGQWERRRVTFKSETDREVWPVIVVWGNPATLWLDDVRFFVEPDRITPNPGAEMPAPLPREQLLAELAKRPASSAAVEQRGGRAVLTIDGQPATPVFYRPSPYDNADGDYAAFAADGVQIISVPFKLGENRSLGGAWRGPGQIDLAHLHKQLDTALGRAPQAKVVLDLMAYPYLDWGQEHREECWTDASGQVGHGWWGNLEGFTDDLAKVSTPQRQHWFYPSYQSDVWRRDSSEAIAQVITQLRQTPYWNSVVGCFIMGGHDGTFSTGFQFDYSRPTRLKFIAWCQSKYGTIATLNAAWGTALGSFEEVSLPAAGDSGAHVESAPPLVGHSPLSDYRQFLNDSAWQLRDAWAGAIKQAAGKPIFTVAYSGGRGIHTAGPALGCQHLDAVGTMSYYPWRRPGIASAFDVPASLARGGKLYFQELDLRSWVGSLHAGPYADYINGARDAAAFDSIHRKLVGISLASDTGWWYYDMHRFFNDPAIHQQIAPVQRLAQRLSTQVAPHRPAPIAVVCPDEGPEYIGAHFSSVSAGMQYQQMQFESSGLNFDMLFLSDLLQSPRQAEPYRMIIFLGCGVLSDAQRQRIDAQLKRDGRWLVWMYDTGYLGQRGADPAAMSELIGMAVRTEPRYTRLQTLLAHDAPKALTQGVEPLQGMSEMVMTIMALQGGSSFVARYQPFWIADAQAQPLMRYHPSNEVAAALRTFDDWTSVYIAAPNALSAKLLHNLAQSAGIAPTGDPGQSLHANDRFASIHGLKNGAYHLTLPPGRTRAVDALSGHTLRKGDGERTCVLQVEAGKTYWLLLE